jgi:hypothetical protein
VPATWVSFERSREKADAALGSGRFIAAASISRWRIALAGVYPGIWLNA